MSSLTDYFYLKRAGRYIFPLNSNDKLPIVYGDLTDGSNGNWVLPCIDVSNYVYAFAGHEVMSVGEGNSISIYADGVLAAPANYTFDESDNYESEGIISTITFTTDQANKVITARGKGKDSAGVLINNIIDIINDFLTVENTFTATLFEPTSKAMAKSTFTKQSYVAAGIINEDIQIWELIQKMIGSFLGSAFLNGSKELVLIIDDGTISQYGTAGIIGKGDLNFISATQKGINLINQCPASYAYNYVKQEFNSHTDDTAHADTVSQNIYGMQKPTSPYRFYWCRNLTAVQKIQDLIVAKFKNPVWEVELEDLSLKNCHLDVNELLMTSIDYLYDTGGDELINEVYKIVSVNPGFSKAKIHFRCLDTGYFLTVSHLLDGSWLLDGSYKLGGDRDTTIF